MVACAVALAAGTGAGVHAVQAAPAGQAAPAVRPMPVAQPAPARQAAPAARGSRAPGGGKVVYLTFDDGPNRSYTPQVLRLLSRYNAKATFFMIGREAKANPALVARVRAGGHAIGNHTSPHPWLPRGSSQAIRSQLRSTDRVLGRTTCMRPPGGFADRRVRAVVASEGKNLIMWGVDPQDWRAPGAMAISHRVLKSVSNKSVVLMHDGGGNRSQTVRALGVILPRLAAQGYRFETLPPCR